MTGTTGTNLRAIFVVWSLAYVVAGGGYSTYGRLYHDSHLAAHSGCRTNLPTSTVLEDAFLAVRSLASGFLANFIARSRPILHYSST